MKICGKWDNRIFPLNLKNSDSDPEDNTNQYPVINLQGFRKNLPCIIRSVPNLNKKNLFANTSQMR
jgi:hypothetical protein